MHRFGKALSNPAAFLALFAFLVTAAPGKDLETHLRAGDYQIQARINRNPPRLGTNTLELDVADGTGRAPAVAKVMVNYYMPPMPRMAPMNYREEAKRKKDKYVLDMDLIMAGPWIIVIKITAAGKTATAKFNIDVP